MNINKLTLVKSVVAMAATVATAPTPLYIYIYIYMYVCMYVCIYIYI